MKLINLSVLLFFITLRISLSAPVNDLCSNATTLTVGTTLSSQTTFSATTTDPACTGTVTADVWYKFTATDSVMNISVTATSSWYSPAIGLYSACGGSLIACGSASSTSLIHQVNNLSIGTIYYIKVYERSGNGMGFNIRVFASPTNNYCSNAITLLPGTPISYSTAAGSTNGANSSMVACTGTVTADVWYKFTATDSVMNISIVSISSWDSPAMGLYTACGGSLIVCSSASSTSLIKQVNNLSIGATYYLRVYEKAGEVMDFNIGVFSSPTNNYCSTATTLTVSTTLLNQTIFGSNSSDPACIGINNADVWYKFIATDSVMNVSADFSIAIGSSTDLPNVSIYSSCGGSMIGCSGATSGPIATLTQNNLIIGNTYYVRVYERSGEKNGNFKMRVFPSPTNNYCSTATTLTVNATLSNQTIFGSNSSDPACIGINNADVWYKFIATDSVMNVSADFSIAIGSSTDLPNVSIYSSCGGSMIGCSGATSGPIATLTQNNLIIGNTYYVRVYERSGRINGNFKMKVFPSPTNNYCDNAVNLIVGSPSSTNWVVGDTYGANILNGTCNGSGMADIWYSFTATDTFMYVAMSSASSSNIGLELHNSCSSTSAIKCASSTGTSCTLNSGGLTIGATYFVRAYQTQGGWISFNIRAYGTISNDNCAGAINIPIGISNSTNWLTYSTFASTQSLAACTGTADDDVWFKFTATDTMVNIDVVGVNSLFRPVIQVFNLCGGTSIQCNSNTTASTIVTTLHNLAIGQTYYFRVYTYGNASAHTSFKIKLYNQVPTVQNITGSTQICSSQSSGIIYSASVTSGNTYNWVITGGVIVSGQTTSTITVNWTNVGTNTLTLTECNTNGCGAPYSILVTVAATPTVSINLLAIDTVCLNNSSIALSGGLPLGGIYSGAGITGSQFNPSTAGIGTHTVTYSFTNSSGCSNTAMGTILVSACLGVDAVDENRVVLIYPNPTSGVFYLETEIDFDKLEIYNAFGQQVLFEKAQMGREINLSNLNDGVYTLVAESKSERITQKVILNK
ncbi:MAG: T9SS type A sorting domain-containing protein [Bacteroidetes bacterium]|nr:T9SS type A sorting domain-containing protein [Bacteroidota bacterium]